MDLPRLIDPAPDYLRLEFRPAPGDRRERLAVGGELDSQTSSLLITAVTEAVARPRLDRLVLDLSGLTFIDAAGVRCLLQCEAAADRTGVRLETCHATPSVLRILEIVGLARHFGFATPARETVEADEVDDLMTRSLRVRRQAYDIRLRAREAVRQSVLLRQVSSARPTRPAPESRSPSRPTR